jgi:hypothetical protein
LEFGADIDLVDARGESALSLAFLSGNEEIVALLLSRSTNSRLGALQDGANSATPPNHNSPPVSSPLPSPLSAAPPNMPLSQHITDDYPEDFSELPKDRRILERNMKIDSSTLARPPKRSKMPIVYSEDTLQQVQNILHAGPANTIKLQQIFELLSKHEGQDYSLSYVKLLQTVVADILQQQLNNSITSDVLFVVWLLLKLTWMRIKFSQFPITSEIQRSMVTLLVRATEADQLLFNHVESQLRTFPSLHEGLCDYLFSRELSKAFNNVAFMIKFHLWCLQVICLHLSKQQAKHVFSEFFNRDLDSLKLFLDRLLEEKHGPLVLSCLKSLPPSLVSEMILGFLSPFMTTKLEISAITFHKFTLLFSLKGMTVSWLKRLANLFRQLLGTKITNPLELGLWALYFWQVCITVDIPNTSVKEIVSILVIPIMEYCLKKSPACFAQVFHQKIGEIDLKAWREILMFSLSTILFSHRLTPNEVASIPREIVDETSLHKSVIQYIAWYAANSSVDEDPLTSICKILDNLLMGWGLEVLGAIVQGFFSKARFAQDKYILFLALTQLPRTCRRYDSQMSVFIPGDYATVKEILAKGDFFSNLEIFPQLDSQLLHSRKCYSPMRIAHQIFTLS